MDFDPRDNDTRERDDLPVHEVRWSDDPRHEDAVSASAIGSATLETMTRASRS